MDWLTATMRHAPPSYFKIGFAIANHLNEKTGKGWPTQEWLAELTGLSLPTVKRAVRFFEKGGWLTVERKHFYDHQAEKWKTRNIYSLDLRCVLDALDGISVMRHERRWRERNGAARDRSVAGDTQTPSESTKRSKIKNLKHEGLRLNAVTAARTTQEGSVWD